ncbi:hypothetical protein PCASD_16360 [Puccinia coronata f. sp. avenae]|uniref:Uncharacterized protein n=1 Tax=Puccinia coronata f. sp. avenae TaxID=200324 RepID=A0A2N5SW32_9BASI|nr:hypothetical protein PCASD_16360 [Puccinia coronata f. sp. avenae]
MQGLHVLRTGVHGRHARLAGPHAKPAVLTPFVGVQTACGMRGRAFGGLHAWLGRRAAPARLFFGVRGGVRTPFGRAAIKPPGLALQVGLSSDATLATEFNCCIKTFIQPGRPNNSIPFDMLVRQVNIIRRQQAFENNASSPPRQNPPVILQAEPAVEASNNPANAPTSLDPDNRPNAIGILAMQVGKCWQCRATDHLLRNCPFRV